MKNDLSNVKVGDWIWTIQEGWSKVEDIKHHPIYEIGTQKGGYTPSGKCNLFDKYPSAFTEPPACFNAPPKPCEFEKGQKVLVQQKECSRWYKVYFSHMEGNRYVCFCDGRTEWSSGSEVTAWRFCKAWEEGEE